MTSCDSVKFSTLRKLRERVGTRSLKQPQARLRFGHFDSRIVDQVTELVAKSEWYPIEFQATR